MSVPVTLSEGSGIAAMELIFNYDSTLLSFPEGGSVTAADLLTDHSITFNGATPGQVSMAIVSFTLFSFNAGSGTVVLLPLEVDTLATPGTQTLLTLKGVTAADTSGNVYSKLGNFHCLSPPKGLPSTKSPRNWNEHAGS
ncbi:cohesin domain-containing protein [Acidobacteria bacterium AH-259-L09]|nr:cohesin domain-containing protein [Acidobacteria bacterium AH-259-L09]